MSATAQVERLTAQVERLKLVRTAEQIGSLLQTASKKDVTYSDFLEELLGLELAANGTVARRHR
jgi:hypothetical protein